MSTALDLNHLPDSYEMPKATWRITLIMGAALVFFLIGFGLASDRERISGWPIILVVVVAYSGILLAIFWRYSLTLDRDGFTSSWLFGSKRYAWRDVSEFKARSFGRSRLIVFDDQTRVDGPLSSYRRYVRGGCNSSITAAFIAGKLDDACATMNAFRARALRRMT